MATLARPAQLVGYRRPGDRTLATLALVAATGIWGTSFVAAKAVLEVVPPLTLAFLRFAVALAVLLPLVYRAGARPALGRGPALLGLTGVALLFLFQNVGLNYTSATNATLVTNGGFPVLAGLLAAVFLRERLGGWLVVGLLASLAGVATIVLGGHNTGPRLSTLGDLLILASVASGAVYSVLGRRAFATGNLVAVLAGSMGYGLLFLSPVVAVELAVVDVGVPSAGDLLLVLYLGVGCSALAFVLWGYGLRHLRAGESAVICNLEVLIGLAAAALLVGEPITSGQAVGGALILGGALLASATGPGPEPARPARSANPDRAATVPAPGD